MRTGFGLPRPTWGAALLMGAAAFFFLAAYNVQSGWLYAVDALIWGVMLVSLAGASAPVSVRLSRLLPARLWEGEPVPLRWRLVNTGSRPLALLELRDAWGGSALVPRLRPHETLELQGEGTAPLRGRHRPAVSLRQWGLGGLFWRPVLEVAPAEVTVWPRLPVLQRWGGRAQGGRGRRDRIRQTAAEGLPAGVRDYRSGDPKRLVHWPTTARRDRLSVKELAAEGGEELSLWIDLRQHARVGDGLQSNLEAVVRAAGAVARHRLAQGDRVRLGASGVPPVWAEREEELLEWLAPLQAQAPELGRVPPGAVAFLLGPEAVAEAQSASLAYVCRPESYRGEAPRPLPASAIPLVALDGDLSLRDSLERDASR